MVSVSFIPSVVSGKLAINTVEERFLVFICPFFVFVEPLFTMQCVNGQSFLYSMLGLTHVYFEF